MGSFAYGVSSDSSDVDIYGFCIPDKSMVFPHTVGEVPGFGTQQNRFEVWQRHHIWDQSAGGGKGKEYDFCIYGIVKYFQLVMENNPNMLDSLFTHPRCVWFITPLAERIRSQRHLFLSTRVFHTMKGYAFQQMHKLKIKDSKDVWELREYEDDCGIPHSITLAQAKEEYHARQKGTRAVKELSLLSDSTINTYFQKYNAGQLASKRFESRKIYGIDNKFAYHVVRLLNEAEQILTEGDLNLDGSIEQLKSIRRGEWTLEDIEEHFNRREKELQALYVSSKLPRTPDEQAIKTLLLDCLEIHYTTLSGCVVREDEVKTALRQIDDIVTNLKIKGALND